MRRAILLAVVILAGLLSGCDEVEEVGMDDEGPEQELSAADILQRVDGTKSAISNFRSVSRSVYTEEHGSQVVVETEQIAVGDDTYTRELSRVGGDVDDSFGPESLYYRGKFYSRSQSGEWVPIEELARLRVVERLNEIGVTEWVESEGSVDFLTADSGDYWFGTDSGYGGLFGDGGEVTRLEDESIDGRTDVRVSRMMTYPTQGLDIEAIIPEGMPNEEREELLSTLYRFPEEMTYTMVLWIDAEFLVYRDETRGEGTRDGRVVQTFETTTEYSDYGTAELPGPLPPP